MKRTLLALAAVAALAMPSRAQQSYIITLANEPGLAYAKTWTLDVSAQGNRASAEVIVASVTYKSATFGDGAQSTGSLTVLSTYSIAGNYLSFGGHRLYAGSSFAVGNTSSNTAANIAAAINADPVLSGLLASTAAAGSSIVYATATAMGAAGNLALYSSTPTALSPSGSYLTGGADAAYALNSGVIQIPGHGFTLGLPLLYSTGTVAIAPLVNQTTYYAIPVDANNVKLATTSALAQAGQFLTLTSSSTQLAAHAYTLAPLAIAGTPSFKWQASNDGLTFADLPVSSVTISAYVAPSSATIQDFGAYNYRYLRLSAVGPSAGGLALQAIIYAKP